MTATRIAAAIAIVFGLLTLVSGGRALFGGADMGAVVGFVLWFNFLAGFAYVLAGVGLWTGRPWAPPLSLAILLASDGSDGQEPIRLCLGCNLVD